MRAASRNAAISLPEIMISMAGSVIVLGALLVSSLSLQKSLHSSEVYAGSYSDQRRLIDYIGRDLRRAVGIEATDTAGAARLLINDTVDVADWATLILTLPGYYKSNDPAAADFENTLPVVLASTRPRYGTTGGSPAPTLKAIFRKVYLAQERSVCFVRQEAGADQVIVREAENLHLQVTVDRDGRTGLVKAWFRSPYSNAQPLVSTYDEMMLRNPRLDQTP